MNRDQAKIIAKKNAAVMYEYLEKFMADKDTIQGDMTFSSSNNKLVVDTFIYQGGRQVFDFHYSMGISAIYADLLTRELSKLLLDGFLPRDSFGVGGYACIKDHPTDNRDGIYVFNDHNSQVNVNFRVKNEEFGEIMEEHEMRISEYRKQVRR